MATQRKTSVRLGIGEMPILNLLCMQFAGSGKRPHLHPHMARGGRIAAILVKGETFPVELLSW
jgi:hypothetical protein